MLGSTFIIEGHPFTVIGIAPSFFGDTLRSDPAAVDPAAVRRVLEVNFFGVLSVTQAMLPLVRNSVSGRIVMVSSGLGSLT